jgi:CheY-like chemotaxis protein
MTATNLYHVAHALGFFNWFPEASRPTGVLVASDDLDTRLALAHHLENLGYDVWTAASGADAYEVGICHPRCIDVLVCDADLPELSAPTLYRRLRTRIPTLRCCVLATDPTHGSAAEAAELGACILDVSNTDDRADDYFLMNAATLSRRTSWGETPEWFV